MSYAQFGNRSEVYVIQSSMGGLVCLGCHLGVQYVTKSRKAMIEHLLEHRHHYGSPSVPESALDRLRKEIGEKGDQV